MAKESFDKFKGAAERLIAKSMTDAATANALMSDPTKAVTAEAGMPLPDGMMLKSEKRASGIVVIPSIDPKYKGELSDKMLGGVSGGYSGSDYVHDFWN